MRSEENLRRVLGLLRDHRTLTRAELARRLGLSRATVSGIVATLLDEGFIREVEPSGELGRRKAGRPGALLSLDAASGAAVGIDADHDCLRVVVADLSHTVLAEAEHPLDIDHDAEEAMTLAAELMHRVVEEAGLDESQILGVGMGVAGPLDTSNGTVKPSSISPSWVGIDVAREMGKRVGHVVHIDNDANLGALGEMMWGAGRGVSEAAYIKVNTGIGASLILGGQIYRGVTGTAGEIGHTTIAEGGPVCRCGNRGCLERFVGAAALLEALRGSRGDLTIDDLLRLAADGDVGCRRVIGDAGRLLGIQLANLCNLFNPERLIIGGSLSAAGDALLAPIRESLDRWALPAAAAAVEVVPAELGIRATVLGAIRLVLRRVDPIEIRPAPRRGSNVARIRPDLTSGSESKTRIGTGSA